MSKRWLILLFMCAFVRGDAAYWHVSRGEVAKIEGRSTDSGCMAFRWGDKGSEWRAVVRFAEKDPSDRGKALARVKGPDGRWVPSGWVKDVDEPLVSQFLRIHSPLDLGDETAFLNPFIKSEDASFWFYRTHRYVPFEMVSGEAGGWKTWLIEWDAGGCGLAGELGCSLLVVEHRASGSVSVRMGFGMGFLGQPEVTDESLRFLFNTDERGSANCWILHPWIFGKGHDSPESSKDLYRWFSSDLVSGDPWEARHWAHQEVAWHIASSDAKGGVAEAFVSHRRWDHRRGLGTDEGALQPDSAPGKREFQWRNSVVVRGRKGPLRFVSPQEAEQLANTGRWDVVLEVRGRRRETVATWLVEHVRDFPHSTPGRTKPDAMQ